MIILLSRRIINQPTLLPLFRHHPHTNQSKTDYLKTLPRIKKDKSMKKTLSDQKRCFVGGTFFASLFHLCLSLFFYYLCFSFKVKQTWLVLCMADYDTDSESPDVSEPCTISVF